MTDLAVIEDAELLPLNEKQAKALDKKIRSAANKVTTSINTAHSNFDILVSLLQQAATGEIHAALGYSSWTAYLKDAVQITPSDRDERKALVQLMAGKGMSVRAIGEVLHVGKTTAARDAEDVPSGTPTTGLDGKTYPPRPEPPQIVDAEVVEEEVKPATAAELARMFDDEVANLHNSLAEMAEIMAEENWVKARKRAAKNLDDLGAYHDQIGTIITDLGE